MDYFFKKNNAYETCTYRISVFHEICKTKDKAKVSRMKSTRRVRLPMPTSRGWAGQGKRQRGGAGWPCRRPQPSRLLGAQVYGSSAPR